LRLKEATADGMARREMSFMDFMSEFGISFEFGEVENVDVW
jgi:hypothetical protein